MTIQSKTDTAISEHVQPPIWQRLAPLLDVVGAVLIAGSWIASHALSQRAQDQAATHEAIIARIRQYRLYDDFAYRISDIQSNLARTRNLVEHASEGSNVLDGQDKSFREAATWTGMSATQIRELNGFVQDLDRYAAQLSTSGTETQSIETAGSRVREVSKAFDSARDEYDRLVEKRNTSTASADDELAAEEEELRKRVDGLWHSYDTRKQNMLHVGDDLLQAAAAQSDSASQLARQCERLSWVLYIIGTLIIMFGRVKSVLGAKKAHDD